MNAMENTNMIQDPATTQALQELREWLELTGCIIQHSSLQGELEAIIERAVKYGRLAALKEISDLLNQTNQ